jgi:FkbM family methyltransferase
MSFFRILSRLIDKVLCSRQIRPSFFVILFNVRSIFSSRMSKNHFVRVKENSDKSGYLILSQMPTRHAINKNFINYAYQRGVVNRALDLAKAYRIDTISFVPGDVIVDCGANLGDLKLYFDYINVDVEYVGFEPSKTEFSCLQKNSHPSACHNLGLWNLKTTLKFFQSSAYGDSSFMPIPRFENSYEIDVVRLDETISGKIKLLKLEAEGCEPEVIMGCEGILGNIDYIAADLGPERGAQGENTVPFVVNYLLARNFEILEFSELRCSVLFVNKKTRNKN